MSRGTGTAAGIGGLFFIGVILAGIVGWIMNIVKLVAQFDADLTAEIVLRIVGIPVAPIGAIMGLFV